jgi:molybdate transport system substrate-binding protein
LPSRAALVLAIGVAAAASCGGGTDGDNATITLDVYAASSLTDAFGELEANYEAANPGVDVRLNLAGSSALRRQIEEGAPADVYAPADPALLDGLSGTIVGDVHVYATNQLTLVVPADPASGPTVDDPGDVADEAVLVARCAVGVPCGDATEHFLAEAGLEVGRSTEEPNVRSVLLKVVSGEADAGFVYTTDAQARAEEVAEIPLVEPPSVELAVAALSDDDHARGFARYVASDEAADVFLSLGFGTP